jgi:hypothetical protein
MPWPSSTFPRTPLPHLFPASVSGLLDKRIHPYEMIGLILPQGSELHFDSPKACPGGTFPKLGCPSQTGYRLSEPPARGLSS